MSLGFFTTLPLTARGSNLTEPATIYNRGAMQITVNGETLELPDPASLADLIERQGLADAACATEVNQRLIPKRDRPEHTLQDGDRVEIVTLVGGG